MFLIILYVFLFFHFIFNHFNHELIFFYMTSINFFFWYNFLYIILWQNSFINVSEILFEGKNKYLPDLSFRSTERNLIFWTKKTHNIKLPITFNSFHNWYLKFWKWMAKVKAFDWIQMLYEVCIDKDEKAKIYCYFWWFLLMLKLVLSVNKKGGL